MKLESGVTLTVGTNALLDVLSSDNVLLTDSKPLRVNYIGPVILRAKLGVNVAIN